MMPSPKRAIRPTPLRCNDCGHQFEGLWSHTSIETTDQGTVGWSPDTDGAGGCTCPLCGSKSIGFRDA